MQTFFHYYINSLIANITFSFFNFYLQIFGVSFFESVIFALQKLPSSLSKLHFWDKKNCDLKRMEKRGSDKS